jgi:hypothetical protein
MRYIICNAEQWVILKEHFPELPVPRKHPTENKLLVNENSNVPFSEEQMRLIGELGIETTFDESPIQYLQENGWNDEE